MKKKWKGGRIATHGNLKCAKKLLFTKNVFSRVCIKQESCYQNEKLKSKIAQILHFLYDKEIITEESILSWHDELDDNKEWIRNSLTKLIEWLNTTSEEETSEEE